MKLLIVDLKLPIDDLELPNNETGLAVDGGRLGIDAILAVIVGGLVV